MRCEWLVPEWKRSRDIDENGMHMCVPALPDQLPPVGLELCLVRAG